MFQIVQGIPTALLASTVGIVGAYVRTARFARPRRFSEAPEAVKVTTEVVRYMVFNDGMDYSKRP